MYKLVRLRSVQLYRFHTQSHNSTSKKVETYYDILKVKKNCSAEEIREAFVKLSKKHHPDVTGGEADSKQKFVKISDAYQTLKKPKSRRNYDQSLLNISKAADESQAHTTGNVHRPWDIKPDINPNPGPYYGFKGFKKTSNETVALILIAIGVLAVAFGYASIKTTFKLNQRRLDEVSAEATSHHAAAVADAKKFGNEEQLRRLVDRARKQGS